MNNMKLNIGHTGSVACSALAVALLIPVVGGCADPFDSADDAQWHAARVVRILKPSELDDSMNRQCVERLEPMPAQVAVVTVRVHRARHFAAFAVPALASVQVKDAVQVNFRLCQLRPAA